MKNSGFTLMEIVLVIVLVGILGITFAVKYSGFEETKLSSAASKLAADIAYAQQLAITTQLYHGISFDSNAEEYYLFRIETNNTQTTIKNPSTGEDFVVEYDFGELQGINLQTVNIGGGTEIIFDWQGIPYDNSKTALTSDATITLEYRGRTKTLTVIAGTGKVSW
ncbi:MAG: prepilin-type N-terminal cleavage/methylation domain-containing protein [Candidatus Omnitrophica bacterium]|nr:prepilin-type N-terminal cleavage/methylation domain-containing protein [Candidatus Omnitrophota bacterium]